MQQILTPVLYILPTWLYKIAVSIFLWIIML